MKIKILVVQNNAKDSDILDHIKIQYPMQGMRESYANRLFEICVSGFRILVIYNGSTSYYTLRGITSEFQPELLNITEDELDDELKQKLKYVCPQIELSEQEYIDKRNLLNTQLNKAIKDLNIQFCQTRRRFKVGDKISNHVGNCIQVDLIGTIAPNSFYNNQDVPIVYYKGARLTKKLEPYKDGDKLTFIDRRHNMKRLD